MLGRGLTRHVFQQNLNKHASSAALTILERLIQPFIKMVLPQIWGSAPFYCNICKTKRSFFGYLGVPEFLVTKRMPLVPEKLKNCSPYKLNEWIAPKSFWARKNYLLNRFLLAKFRVSNGQFQSCQNSAQTRTPHGLNGMNTKNPNPGDMPVKKSILWHWASVW